MKKFVPQIVELLNDGDRNVQSAGADIVAKLVEQRK
jgi:hypothetical protein